jgi:hypothetical protein
VTSEFFKHTADEALAACQAAGETGADHERWRSAA